MQGWCRGRRERRDVRAHLPSSVGLLRQARLGPCTLYQVSTPPQHSGYCCRDCCRDEGEYLGTMVPACSLPGWAEGQIQNDSGQRHLVGGVQSSVFRPSAVCQLYLPPAAWPLYYKPSNAQRSCGHGPNNRQRLDSSHHPPGWLSGYLNGPVSLRPSAHTPLPKRRRKKHPPCVWLEPQTRPRSIKGPSGPSSGAWCGSRPAWTQPRKLALAFSRWSRRGPLCAPAPPQLNSQHGEVAVSSSSSNMEREAFRTRLVYSIA